MKDYFYTIHLETPSKKNSRVTNRRTGRSFPSKRYNEWHKAAEAEIASQELPEAPIGERVYVYGSFVRSDRRRRDNNNSGASILDLFVDMGILADDNDEIVVKETWEKLGVDKGNPVARICIKSLTKNEELPI